MIEKDVLGLLISIISAGIASYAVVISRIAVNKQIHALKWNVNHDLHARAREMLIDNPKLLALHSIDTSELEQDGIAYDELIYILHHIDAGSAYHRINDEEKVELTPFRKKFLENPKVRLAWKKYLRGMFNPWAYSQAIDDYIAQLEGQQSALGNEPHQIA